MVLSRSAERVREAASHLRLAPFDTATPEGRSRERHRRALLTGISALLAKVIAVSTSLVTIPMTLRYLGTERFGLWMTISSVVAILGFADFGIGNGVLNVVADAHGKEDIEEIRRSVSSAFAMLSLVGVAILAIFATVYRLVDWGHFFNVSSQLARREAGPATAVFILCFALNVPADVVQRLQLGIQEGFISKLWQLAGSIAGLVGVILVIHFRLGLPWLLGALAGAPLLVTVANNIVFFGWMRPDLRPGFRLVSGTVMHRITRLGLLFFVLQVVVAVAYSSDNFVIAKLLGPDAVTRYSVTAKMFSLISLGLSMFLGPLWPAYGEAASRGDLTWIKRTLIRSTAAASILAAVAALVLVIFGPTVLKFWVHQPISPSLLLLLGLGLWSVMDAAGQSVAAFLNGVSVILSQAIIASVFAVGCLTLKIYFVHKLGIAGVPWATLLSYAGISAVPLSIVVPRVLASLRKDPHQMIHSAEILNA
ncbi:MAG: oligosaccharide flippase family protein [Silvibacterium sp.]